MYSLENTENNQENFNFSRSGMESLGMSSKLINDGYIFLKDTFPALHSLLIVRKGKLVFENYNTGPETVYKNLYSSLKKIQYRGIGKISRFSTLSFKDSIDEGWNIRAVTNAIVSLLVGIAIENEYIQSLDQRAIDFFPEYTNQTIQEKKNITLRHLISMMSGIESIEKTSLSIAMLKSDDWVRFILNLNAEANPGEKFEFNPGNCHLLSAVISRASGMSTLAFAQKHLFGPLGIKITKWETDRKGFNFGGSNLFMKPLDMAKIGLVLINKGTIGGRTIVSNEWIKESLKKTTRCDEESYYGYYWRIRSVKSEVSDNVYTVYYASGASGQRIYLIPSLEVVMTTTGRLSFGFDKSYNINRFIEKHLLPSIESME